MNRSSYRHPRFEPDEPEFLDRKTSRRRSPSTDAFIAEMERKRKVSSFAIELPYVRDRLYSSGMFSDISDESYRASSCHIFRAKVLKHYDFYFFFDRDLGFASMDIYPGVVIPEEHRREALEYCAADHSPFGTLRMAPDGTEAFFHMETALEQIFDNMNEMVQIALNCLSTCVIDLELIARGLTPAERAAPSAEEIKAREDARMRRYFGGDLPEADAPEKPDDADDSEDSDDPYVPVDDPDFVGDDDDDDDSALEYEFEDDEVPGILGRLVKRLIK